MAKSTVYYTTSYALCECVITRSNCFYLWQRQYLNLYLICVEIRICLCGKNCEFSVKLHLEEAGNKGHLDGVWMLPSRDGFNLFPFLVLDERDEAVLVT